MNILLVGGSGSLINNLIIKLNKEGHRLYLLTGNRYKQAPYQKVFERYDFTYDCACLNEIFESINPDLTIYMGAFDTNYRWIDEQMESVRYASGLDNILMAYIANSTGRFIYLSSHEVYSGDYREDILETEPLHPGGYRSLALVQSEEVCESYRKYRNKDIIILRLDHLYSIPHERKDIDNICARMCLEVMEKGTITITEGNSFSMLYETDAVEYIYRLIGAKEHRYSTYHLSSGIEISEKDIADMVETAMGETVSIETTGNPASRRVLSNRLLDSEFGNPFCCEVNVITQKMASYMKKNAYLFLKGEDVKMPFWKRLTEKSGWFVKALIPFVENVVAFVFFFYLNQKMSNGALFSMLDFYLIYVLLFAVFYGQQQATFSAILSVFGYYVTQMTERSGFQLMLDSNTYVWIAQLFILGLSVGYIKDKLNVIKNENEEERDFILDQLNDIQDINSSNVRVKDALETQIVNQSDSVGKIYSITSTLEQYSADEVMFYAAEILAKLMRSRDVAIYLVSNADYARLFSYTSPKAKELGNSIRYSEMGEFYETIKSGKVFINRKMDERYPLMANAIFENDKMQMMLFVWDITWERMTLGQANQLAIISSLIQNAVIRANKYLAVLENQRYVQDSRMLEPEAFGSLVRAYLQARNRGVTECVLLKILTEPENYFEAGKVLATKLRLSDYVGTLKNGNMYVLLANTSETDASFVIKRFLELGYETEMIEGVME